MTRSITADVRGCTACGSAVRQCAVGAGGGTYVHLLVLDIHFARQRANTYILLTGPLQELRVRRVQTCIGVIDTSKHLHASSGAEVHQYD